MFKVITQRISDNLSKIQSGYKVMPFYMFLRETPEYHKVGKSQAIFSLCNSFFLSEILNKATISKP
jgi:hypothetical protein